MPCLVGKTDRQSLDCKNHACASHCHCTVKMYATQQTRSAKQSVGITGEVSQVTNDCLLLTKINNFVIEFNSTQASHWQRRYLLCALHHSVYTTYGKCNWQISQSYKLNINRKSNNGQQFFFSY